MKGGHLNSGPAPDPLALRRDREKVGDWTHLPAAGRTAPAPVWPLTRPTARETVLWLRQWARPQALIWEREGLFEEVAVYCRTLAVAERPKATVAARTLLRQQMDSLGMTAPAMARLRWIIDPPEDAHEALVVPGTSPTAIRDRLRVAS